MIAHTILVGVANPETVSSLMYTACLMAKQVGGRLVVASVVPPPSADSRSDEDRAEQISRAEALLRQALDYARQQQMDCDSTMAVARQIHEGLVDVAEAQHAQVILVGFSGSPEPSLPADEDFDRIMDALAAQAPCHLLVAKFRDGEQFDRVLVPLASKINLDLTRDLVTTLHYQAGATIDFVHFAATAQEAEHRSQELQGWLQATGVADCGAVTVQIHPEPAEAIVAATHNYDAVVVGTPPLHTLRRRLFGSVAEHIANHAACTTYLVRSRERP